VIAFAYTFGVMG